MLQKAKPYAAMAFQQLSFAAMSIIFLSILKDGTSQAVLFVYRNIVAAVFIAPFALYFERKRPLMTRLIFIKIMALGLFQAVLEQNLYFLGTKLTSPTFAAALKNLIPSITFFLSLVLSVEKLNIHQIPGKAKLAGVLLTLAGSLLMVIYRGPVQVLPWSKGPERLNTTANSNISDKFSLRWLMGTLMVLISSTSWSIFLLLQSNTLKSYGAKLSLTSMTCCAGALMNIIIALFLGHGSYQSWIISWDMRLFAIIYSGVVCTGITNYLLEMVVKERGPVFAGAFSPLCMIITAILGSLILAERIHLGTIIGGIIVTAGLYSLLWGKSKDCPTQTTEDCGQSKEYLMKSDLSMVKPRLNTEQYSITIDHQTTEEGLEKASTKALFGPASSVSHSTATVQPLLTQLVHS